MSDATDGDDLRHVVETTFNTTVHYIADHGDWVRLADGTPGTVIHAGPFWDPTRNRSGVNYTILLKGGAEKTYHHLDGDDHFTVTPHFGADKTEPLFTVLDPNHI